MMSACAEYEASSASPIAASISSFVLRSIAAFPKADGTETIRLYLRLCCPDYIN